MVLDIKLALHLLPKQNKYIKFAKSTLLNTIFSQTTGTLRMYHTPLIITVYPKESNAQKYTVHFHQIKSGAKWSTARSLQTCNRRNRRQGREFESNVIVSLSKKLSVVGGPRKWTTNDYINYQLLSKLRLQTWVLDLEQSNCFKGISSDSAKYMQYRYILV